MFTYHCINFSKSIIFSTPAYCLPSGLVVCSWWHFPFKDPKCNQVPVFLSASEVLRDQGQMHWAMFQLQKQKTAEKRHFKSQPTQCTYFTEGRGKEAWGCEVTHPRSHTAGGRVWIEAQPLNSSTLMVSDKTFTVTLLFYLLFIPCLLQKRIGASSPVIYFCFEHNIDHWILHGLSGFLKRWIMLSPVSI